VFEYHISVRGYELDSYGHVNNAVYVSYTEQARWQILNEMKLLDEFRSNHLFLFVIENHIRYSRESGLFDNLVIRTRLSLTKPYLVFIHKIYNTKSGLKIAESRVKTLLVDQKKTVVDFPPEILKYITNEERS
jgi:YbgC/YbaW family acyl-CoA thioester hydrolase